MHDEDDGMRIVRGTGNKPKLSRYPDTLDQVAPGQVVLIAVRVVAHLAGPAKGPYTTTLVRVYDDEANEELYACGDLVVKQTQRVAVSTMVEP